MGGISQVTSKQLRSEKTKSLLKEVVMGLQRKGQNSVIFYIRNQQNLWPTYVDGQDIIVVTMVG